MSIHAPAHPSGVVSPQIHRHHLAWLVAVVAAVVLASGVLLVIPNVVPTSTTTTEGDSIVAFRAAERADWAAGATSERDSLIQFRAGERNSP